MRLTIGSIVNMTPAPGPWEIAFDPDGGSDMVVCPVIGWATVVTAHMKDASVHTELKPAFVWGDMVWTETELREHTPGLGGITLRHATIPATAGPWRTRPACPMHDTTPGQDIPGGPCICDA
ncbi:hypothetical protein [Streptomyces phaeochromogenes]